MTDMSSGSSISGRPAINRSITAMCQAKGRNTICGRGPSSCLLHLTLLDTIHRHPPGNSPLLSGVHPDIICIIQKRPIRQGETDFHCRKRHTSGNASTIPYEWRRETNIFGVPPLVTYWIVSTDYSKATISLSVSTIQPKPIAGRSVRGVLFM